MNHTLESYLLDMMEEALADPAVNRSQVQIRKRS